MSRWRHVAKCITVWKRGVCYERVVASLVATLADAGIAFAVYGFDCVGDGGDDGWLFRQSGGKRDATTGAATARRGCRAGVFAPDYARLFAASTGIGLGNGAHHQFSDDGVFRDVYKRQI